MKPSTSIFLYLVFVALPLSVTAQPGLSSTEFLSRTLIAHLEVSPDGRHVAFISVKDDFKLDRAVTTLWKVDINAANLPGKPVALSNGSTVLSNIRWSPNSRHIAVSSVTGNNPAQLQVFDIETNRNFFITGQRSHPKGINAFNWATSGNHLYYAVNESIGEPIEDPKVVTPFQNWDSAAYILNIYVTAILESGPKATRLAAAIKDTRALDFSVSPDEKTVVFKPASGLFTAELKSDSQPKRLTPAFPCLDNFRWIQQGIVMQACGGSNGTRVERTQRRIYLVDPADGKLFRLAANFNGELWLQDDVADGRVIALGNLSTSLDLYSIDVAKPADPSMLRGPGKVKRLSSSANGKLVAYTSALDDEVYVRSEANQSRQVTDFNRGKPAGLGIEVETISWDNGDGDKIEGLLYHPPGRKAEKDLPTLVYVHSGPFLTQTEPFYYPLSPLFINEAYFYAAQGYRVFAPNYRGSPGRGDAFLQALINNLCSRPVKDILSGVDHLVEQRLADPARLGVRGGSYGGRLANCLIGQTTRFKAATAQSAHWNLISSFESMNGKLPWDNLQALLTESPITYAGKIKTPTLITIGENDEVVDPNQAREQKRAFNALRVPSELLIFPGEKHAFQKPSNKRIRLDAQTAWLDHYILGKPLRPVQKASANIE